MLAARKVSPKSAAKWQAALAQNTTFDSLSFSMISEWTGNEKLSIYELSDINELPMVAMGLSMATGEGPKGLSFLVLDFAALTAAKLWTQKSKGETLHGVLDQRHHDIILRSGEDLRKLIEVFLDGDFRSTTPDDVLSRTLTAIDQDEYDVPEIAGSLKRQISDNLTQKVCNSTLRLVGTGDLTISGS